MYGRQQNKSKVRIIAGHWRSRKIEFLNLPTIRPTPDRVRETLFNWLAPTIRHANCLDLFAGSGALAFEALSRGAARAVLVDYHPAICQQLKKQVALLKADNAIVVHQDANTYIKNAKETFDVIFLDPPFDSNLIHTLTIPPQLLSSRTLVYLETAETNSFELPKVWAGWEIIRSAKTSQIQYLLLAKQK